jgi:hypothetical protein
MIIYICNKNYFLLLLHRISVGSPVGRTPVLY